MPELQAQLTDYLVDVWRTSYRLLGNSEDARECSQQTFADALKVDPATVRSWRAVLCRIATRRAMDLLRDRYRDRNSLQRLDAEPLEEVPPDADLGYKELCQKIRQSLATLSALQAEAFWLRHVEEWSPEDIGRELNIEAGHVRVLVHRAVRHLRQSRNRDYGELLTHREEQ